MAIKRGDVGGLGTGSLNTIDEIVAQVAAEVRRRSLEAEENAKKSLESEQKAEESADRAEDFATLAENSAILAKQSEDVARDYRLQALDSAEEAATKADEAALSATDSENSAIQSANGAALSLQYRNEAELEADRARNEADRAEAAADNLGMANIPLFFVAWCPDRNSIWPGYVAADGQQLSSATYPDAAAGIAAGTVPTTDDATWLADPTQRGKYVADDGSGFFRVPDYNGKQAGSLGAVFLRGDGALSAGHAGLIQRDAFQGHKFQTPLGGGTDIPANWEWGLGEPVRGATGSDYRAGMPAAYTSLPMADGINGTPRTASETRPLNVTGCWVIKLYGEVVNVGSADAEQLASDYANLNGTFQALDSQLDFTIIYPGGGDASSPGNVTINTRYVVPSPYPGYHLHLRVELLYDGKWVTTGAALAANTVLQSGGVLVGQEGDDIVVRTGTTILLSNNQGSLLSTAESVAGNQTTLPCRVKVWKVKGAL